MHHLIYLPQSKTVSSGHLIKAGLGDHALGAQTTVLDSRQQVGTYTCDDETREIPGGGALISWDGAPPLKSLPLRKWIPAMPVGGPAGRYFVGIDEARPPEPVELLRPHPFAGTPVTLGDGSWVIPHAAELPFDFIRNGQTGEFEYQPRPQFYDFWIRCLTLQRQFDQAAKTEDLPSDVEQAEFAEEALRLNYRLTPEVIAYLRLFTVGESGTLAACMAATRFVRPEDR